MDIQSLRDRLVEADQREIRAADHEVHLGTAFAFMVPKEGRPGPGEGGGGQGMGAVRSLLGPVMVKLSGATLLPVDLGRLRLASLTSDKSLYREGEDVVNLLAVDPLLPDGKVVVIVRRERIDYARHPIRLDQNGCTAVSLRDLPAGSYEVSFDGAPTDEIPCEFTVAERVLDPALPLRLQRSLHLCHGRQPRGSRYGVEAGRSRRHVGL
ncbi:hypothetical protein ACFL59_08950 [Planctomycetota bacterium]